METARSKHFIVHFNSGSTAQVESDKILKLLEECYKKVTKELNLGIEPVINVYLYETQADKKLATGEEANAHTDRVKYEFFAVYNPLTKSIGAHELVHLLTNHLGLPNYLFNEGLAEYFEDDWVVKINGVPKNILHGKVVNMLINEGKYIPISYLFDDERFWELDPDGAYSYPESGSFIKYLVGRFGIKKVLQAYTRLERKSDVSNNKSVFADIFRQQIEDIEKDYLKYLSNLSAKN